VNAEVGHSVAWLFPDVAFIEVRDTETGSDCMLIDLSLSYFKGIIT
jgi:hypothetical protein